jgi:hypothetical protein
MKQHEAVILALECLGGIATLGQLYEEAFKIPACKWATKTPFASIRRIVQLRKEIYKIKPGLYGLESKRSEHERRGIVAETQKNKNSAAVTAFGHTYYQGLLLIVGKLRDFECWSPNQDRNKTFLNTTLGAVRTLKEMPRYSYDRFVNRSATVDVIWFNDRKMPSGFFEVEHGGDIQNSLLKFNDLQDFHARMFIVSDTKRKEEYEDKIKYTSFRDISKRVEFLPYDWVVKEYEHAIEASRAPVTL